MIAAAQPYLRDKSLHRYHFTLDFTDDTSLINDSNLTRYQVFVMLQLAPFDMSYGRAGLPCRNSPEEGKGFVVIHAPVPDRHLLPRARPYARYWQWFEELHGRRRLLPAPAPSKKPPSLSKITQHPVTRHLPVTFFPLRTNGTSSIIAPGTMYTSWPASTNHSYHPNRTHGRSPHCRWTEYERYRRMIYISHGRLSRLSLADTNYQILLRDAIRWAASLPIIFPPSPPGTVSVYYQKIYSYDPSLSQAGSLPARPAMV